MMDLPEGAREGGIGSGERSVRPEELQVAGAEQGEADRGAGGCLGHPPC